MKSLHLLEISLAQLVELRAVTREVVSSTPAGPIRSVLKSLNRKCSLCNYISKWLDFQVFSDKDYKPEVPSLTTLVHLFCGTLKNPHTLRKE